MRTAIISNGTINDYKFTKVILDECEYIICADGGIRHAYIMEIKPHVVIGDLDSASPQIVDYYRKQDVDFVKYNYDKDKTDTQLCLEYALNFSDEVLMLGALGLRMDHTLANISLLKLGLDNNKLVKLIDEKNEICMISNEILLQGKPGDIISLLPISEIVTGINIKGVHYELVDAKMEIGNPYGVSNYFEKESVHIQIASGYLLVIKSSD